jgi:hypothetical protein
MPDILTERRNTKDLREQYRKAARKVHGKSVDVNAHVHVLEDGAFVEINVWISKESLNVPTRCTICGAREESHIDLQDGRHGHRTYLPDSSGVLTIPVFHEFTP